MYFYMYKYVYIFRDLESGLSRYKEYLDLKDGEPCSEKGKRAGGGLWRY